MYVEKCLKRTWDWMFAIMDSTEAQLKFGAYLTNYSDHTHPLHPLNLSSQNNANQSNNGGGGSGGGSSNGSVGINMLGWYIRNSTTIFLYSSIYKKQKNNKTK